MSSMTFLINDSATGGNLPLVQVTITEGANGTLTFTLTQLTSAGAYLGDLRGLFFDVADESLLGSLSTVGTATNQTEFVQGNDTIKDLGDGANMQGLLGSDGGYDVGIEIGTSGLRDDVRSFSFTLDSSARDLTLADFSNVSFGIRMTSVGQDLNGDGTIDTARNGSVKMGEVTFSVVSPQDEVVSLFEDQVASHASVVNGNLLANDGAGIGDTLAIGGWTDGTSNFTAGSSFVSSALAGATVRINADGTWSVDASATDSLAEGEVVTQTFTYTVLQNNVDGSSSQTATFTVTINGTNDGPVITSGAQSGSVKEDTTLTATGQVTSSDVDNGASASYSGDATGSYGSFAVNATSGVWTYNLDNAAHQNLAQGETHTETFAVTVTDEFGATATQDVEITITGTNDAPVISGAASGAADEDTALTASGQLASADIDNSATAAWSVQGSASGSYGSIAVDAAGLWTYTLANGSDGAAGAVQNLGANDAVTDTFTVRVTDDQGGFDEQVVTINITGTADGPVAAPAVYNGADANDFDTAGAGPVSVLAVPTGSVLNGDNTIRGTNTGESIDARNGADTVYGYGGNDTLSGGNGTDSIYGGTGNDTIAGGADTDTIYGGSGNDTINGNAHTDVIYGGSGNDTIAGDADDDVIIGGFGADTLSGNAGADTFKFLDAKDTGDTINFVQADADKIDFQALYGGTLGFTANTTTLTNYGAIAFYDAGTGNTIVQVDTDGDAGTAELQIQLTGNVSLTAADFQL